MITKIRNLFLQQIGCAVVRSLVKQQHGSAIVFVSVSLLVLLSMTGLVMDAGTVYVEKTHMQQAANAAALSGAQELTNSNAAVNKVVTHIITDHQEQNSQVVTNIQNAQKVGVDISKQVPLTFASLFGRGSTEVTVHAAAEVIPIGKVKGVSPVGIDDSIPLTYNVQYVLKLDSPEHSNTGILVLDVKNNYEENLTNGYQGEIKIGDILETKSGVVTGPTRSAIQSRIDRCPNPGGDINIKNCARVILVPVYTPYKYKAGDKLDQVKITGFAYFYITDPSDKGKDITGKFIRRTGAGTADPAAGDHGAYGIRLTE